MSRDEESRKESATSPLTIPPLAIRNEDDPQSAGARGGSRSGASLAPSPPTEYTLLKGVIYTLIMWHQVGLLYFCAEKFLARDVKAIMNDNEVEALFKLVEAYLAGTDKPRYH